MATIIKVKEEARSEADATMNEQEIADLWNATDDFDQRIFGNFAAFRQWILALKIER